MLRLRSVIRPAVSLARAVPLRAFSVSLTRFGGATPSTDSSKPVIPGFREAGQVPTNYEIATGIERHETLAHIAGEEPFEDMKPLFVSKLGTPMDPIVVTGVDSERYIGCTGVPVDSHDAIWLTVRPHGGVDRCPHCGNCFKYVQVGGHDHHH
ncbi:cytochrome c oxidase subunit VB-domain-containing protein [Cladochytrium replicatum]|nr:cytochrome c oxidase subunit VB-domain-containing protein [Cladochytrium replicatum]